MTTAEYIVRATVLLAGAVGLAMMVSGLFSKHEACRPARRCTTPGCKGDPVVECIGGSWTCVECQVAEYRIASGLTHEACDCEDTIQPADRPDCGKQDPSKNATLFERQARPMPWYGSCKK